jgi:short-subunit dehydrogenase
MITKEVLPFLIKNGGGSIIYVSSAGAYHPPVVEPVSKIIKTASMSIYL